MDVHLVHGAGLASRASVKTNQQLSLQAFDLEYDSIDPSTSSPYVYHKFYISVEINLFLLLVTKFKSIEN